MKKIVALFAFASFLSLGTINTFAQDETNAGDSAAQVTNVVEETPAEVAQTTETVEAPAPTITQEIKRYFVEGGAEFMTLVAIALIIGLAVGIERVIYLNLSSTNTEKLLAKIDAAMKNGGVKAAKEVCDNTAGPIAGVFSEGLSKADEGIEMVEKTIVSYGSVEMTKLESGLPWLSLMIALGPMLGFLGTVVGMIYAFDAIAAAGDINPTVVAGGIKVALLTTVGGLIVAIILQILYNYLLSKIESVVGDMEEASISFIDILVKNGIK